MKKSEIAGRLLSEGKITTKEFDILMSNTFEVTWEDLHRVLNRQRVSIPFVSTPDPMQPPYVITCSSQGSIGSNGPSTPQPPPTPVRRG